MQDLKYWIAQGRYFLHIRPDGSGERLEMSDLERRSSMRSAERQILPCLPIKIVEVDGVVFEETTTKNMRPEWIPVRPRGKGWKVHDQRSDHWTVYRRTLRP